MVFLDNPFFPMEGVFLLQETQLWKFGTSCYQAPIIYGT